MFEQLSESRGWRRPPAASVAAALLAHLVVIAGVARPARNVAPPPERVAADTMIINPWAVPAALLTSPTADPSGHSVSPMPAMPAMPFAAARSQLSLPALSLSGVSAPAVTPAPARIDGALPDGWAHRTSIGDIAVQHAADAEPPEVIGRIAPIPAAGPGDDAVSGTVLVEYVVDSAGRVAGGSVRAIRVDHPAQLAAVVKALEAARFRPGRVDHRPVAMRVRQQFAFRSAASIGER